MPWAGSQGQVILVVFFSLSLLNVKQTKHGVTADKELIYGEVFQKETIPGISSAIYKKGVGIHAINYSSTS